MKLVIINGPNLNLLGSREKEVYGETSFDEYLLELKEKFDVELDYYQSNVDLVLIKYFNLPGKINRETNKVFSKLKLSELKLKTLVKNLVY